MLQKSCSQGYGSTFPGELTKRSYMYVSIAVVHFYETSNCKSQAAKQSKPSIKVAKRISAKMVIEESAIDFIAKFYYNI